MAGLAELSHKAQRAAASVIIDHVLSNAKKDREKAFLDIVDFAEKFWGDGMSKENYDKVREAIRHPEGNKWIRFINRVLDETGPAGRSKMAALNLGFEAVFRRHEGDPHEPRRSTTATSRGLMLLDPTCACTMHCTGCWAGSISATSTNLSYRGYWLISSAQGKELGAYLYMLTGGEPLVRKKDILASGRESINDCRILSASPTGTLIDEEFCEAVQSVWAIPDLLRCLMEGFAGGQRRSAAAQGHSRCSYARDGSAEEARSCFVRHVHLLHESTTSRPSPATSSSRSFARARARAYGWYFHYHAGRQRTLHRS